MLISVLPDVGWLFISRCIAACVEPSFHHSRLSQRWLSLWSLFHDLSSSNAKSRSEVLLHVYVMMRSACSGFRLIPYRHKVYCITLKNFTWMLSFLVFNTFNEPKTNRDQHTHQWFLCCCQVRCVKKNLQTCSVLPFFLFLSDENKDEKNLVCFFVFYLPTMIKLE